MNLNEFDIRALRMLSGEIDVKWGSWLTECLEHLASLRLCTNGPNYQITEAGRAALAERSEG